MTLDTRVQRTIGDGDAANFVKRLYRGIFSTAWSSYQRGDNNTVATVSQQVSDEIGGKVKFYPDDEQRFSGLQDYVNQDIPWCITAVEENRKMFSMINSVNTVEVSPGHLAAGAAGGYVLVGGIASSVGDHSYWTTLSFLKDPWEFALVAGIMLIGSGMALLSDVVSSMTKMTKKDGYMHRHNEQIDDLTRGALDAFATPS